ncbi:MAG TPA: hypothetical protein VG225_06275 [Terracidiphilus sp.]|jgi:hypothetical protein|nr:hypothetical protein [Terracidiphilus sp.]
MSERTRNPFVLRHPISLGDAIAALFRAKPKKTASAKSPSGLGPAFQQADSPAQPIPAIEVAEKSHSPAQVVTMNSMQ